MPLSSMTGFARASGGNSAASWVWELKSVNGKALDTRLRLPPQFDHLEPEVRALISQPVKRGSLQVNLSLLEAAQNQRIVINRDVLEQYLAVAEEIRLRTGALPPSAESLLGRKGVVEPATTDLSEQQQESLDRAVMHSLGEALAALVTARRNEGQKLGDVLALQIDKIEGLTESAEKNPSRAPDSIKQRLKMQVAALQDMPGLDDTRLHQEAVLLATRADIREELDRLKVHIASARELLRDAAPIGRKFDFLAQEFNREANTLCSKANDASLTGIGLELKTVIDQLREQVQNVE